MAENGETDQALKEEIKTESPMETDENVERTEAFQLLIDYGIGAKVAAELDNIYKTGLMQHEDLDNRALDALKDFPEQGAIQVLQQFKESDLEHVTNKSAYLCGVMKAFRQKFKLPNVEKRGPDEAKIREILNRTGYTLDVTTGQRKYGGPPPDYDGAMPGNGQEVFCGKIPRDIFEDELIPLFENCGKIWDLRLMMDPGTGQNRGYCFVTFCDRSAASKAVKELDNKEIRPGKKLKVNGSVANTRLFIGNIPKSKSREEILEEFKKMNGVEDVIIYGDPDYPVRKKNRGFAFVEFDSHKNASAARRRLCNGRRIWGCEIIVDWADPQEEPDDETMNKVKVLYVRRLTQDVTEEMLKEQFEKFGPLERVKKQKDYAFVHFEDRDNAVAAKEGLHGTELGKCTMEIALAKPQSESAQKRKEARKREGERHRMMMQMMSRGHPDWGARGRGMRRPFPPGDYYRGDYDFGGYGDYGYNEYYDYRGGYNDPYYDEFMNEWDYGYGGGYGGGPSPRGRGRGGPPAKVSRGRGGMRGRGNMSRGGSNRGGFDMDWGFQA